jgi:hypothetical protein
MNSTRKFVNYTITVLVILLLVGLAGWYYFLNQQKQAITTSDAGRGLDSASPSFGGSAGSTYSNVSGSDTQTISGDRTKTPPRLWQVTKTPVAGMGFVETARAGGAPSASSNTQLYFAERGTGHILKADPVTGAVVRLTNKLFPRVYEAVFGSDGAVVLRSIDDAGDVTSFAGEFSIQNATSSAQTDSTGSANAVAISGNYLMRNLLAVVPKQGAHELLLLVPTGSGGSSIVSSSWDGTKQEILFASPLSGWKLYSLSDGRIFISLLPSDNVSGYAYEIKAGGLVPRVQDIPGLTFLPRSSSDDALAGQSGGGDVSLFYSPKSGAGAENLPIRTTADKCVWAQPASAAASGNKSPLMDAGSLIAYCAVPQYFISDTFLSDWYRGAIHTSDTWWRIDAGTGQVTPVLEPGETSQTFDVENPVIDKTGANIAFMNAADKTLWLLRISKDTSTTATSTTQQ